MWWYLEDSFGILVVIRHTVVGKNSFILFFFISFKLYVCKFHRVCYVLWITKRGSVSDNHKFDGYE